MELEGRLDLLRVQAGSRVVGLFGHRRRGFYTMEQGECECSEIQTHLVRPERFISLVQSYCDQVPGD